MLSCILTSGLLAEGDTDTAESLLVQVAGNFDLLLVCGASDGVNHLFNFGAFFEHNGLGDGNEVDFTVDVVDLEGSLVEFVDHFFGNATSHDHVEGGEDQVHSLAVRVRLQSLLKQALLNKSVTELEVLLVSQLRQVNFLNLRNLFFVVNISLSLSPPASLAGLLLESLNQLSHLGTLKDVHLVALEVLDVVEEEWYEEPLQEQLSGSVSDLVRGNRILT